MQGLIKNIANMDKKKCGKDKNKHFLLLQLEDRNSIIIERKKEYFNLKNFSSLIFFHATKN